MLAAWTELLAQGAFVKVMPHDYKRVLRRAGGREAQVARRDGVAGGGGLMVRRRKARRLMGKLGGFLQIERHGIPYRDPVERAHDYHEFMLTRPTEELREQGARCMDCGVPFCHNGCPLGNLIPDWNDLVYRDRWQDAIVQLHATNNFPEFTGRLCPAPCEASCVLEIREGDAVTIKQIEHAIINRAWEEGWVAPQPPRHETGQAVAVVGSGPAGMAAAQQLRRAGHRVDAVRARRGGRRAGALRRAGLQDRKDGRAAARRAADRRGRGAALRGGRGREVERARSCAESFDAVVLATGSRVPRDLPVPGRELDGVHFAMDYLYQRNRWVARELGPAPDAPQPASGAGDQRGGQGRGRDRRRRHRRGLRRQRAARGRALDRPARAAARAARAPPRRSHARGRSGR